MDILETLQNGVFWLLLKIDALIYTFINWLYQIILLLAKGNIFKDNNVVDEVINRLYIVIGVVVLFVVAYTLLRNMTNPDETLKGKESPVKLISNVIISIVAIALTPTIFNFVMDFQNALLNQNTIGKIILGESYTDSEGNSYNSSNVIAEGGFEIANTIFQAFFMPEAGKEAVAGSGKGYCTGIDSIDANSECIVLDGIEDKTTGGTTDYSTWWQNNVVTPKTFFNISQLNEIVAEGKINYMFLFSTVAGVFVVFVLISYCIDIAIRLVKLSVFQLIAPLPILARIVPKDDVKKIFDNWLKATISTFVEVFIRLAILFFGILIIRIVRDNFFNIFSLATDNWGSVNKIIVLLAQAFVILGIIMFVKQAPEIIKEITGLDGGKYGKSLMRGIGMMTATLGGGTTATIRTAVNDKDHHGLVKGLNAFRTGLGAARRGLYHGYKVEKPGDIPKAAGTASANTLAKRAKVEAAGGNLKYLKQWAADKKKDAEGWVTGGFEAQQKILEQINAVTQNADAVKSKTEGFVRDKKYMFSMTDSATPTTETYSKGTFDISKNTSLSEIEAIIQTLKSTGDASDSQLADRLNNDMQIRIKNIGKELSKVATGDLADTSFENDYVVHDASTGTAKFGIRKEATVELSETASQFELVKKRINENPNLAGLKEVESAFPGGLAGLKVDEASDLSKALKSSAAGIQQQITLEQERRKAKEKK